MNKQTITKSQIIKDGNYYKRILAHSAFVVVGTVFPLISISNGEAEKITDYIVSTAIIGLFIVLFGYFLGIKMMLSAYKDVSKIKTGKFHIEEKKIIDKITTISCNDDDVQLAFSAEDSIWVSRKKARNFHIGDVAYLIFLEGDTEASGIYNKAKYSLDEDFNSKVTKRHYEPLY